MSYHEKLTPGVPVISKSPGLPPSSPAALRMDSSNTSSFAAVLRDLAKNAVGEMEAKVRGEKVDSPNQPPAEAHTSALLDVRKVSFLFLAINSFF